MSNAQPLPNDESAGDAPAEAPVPTPAEGGEPSLVERTLQGLRDEDWSPRGWIRLFRDLYFTFDRRTLGFTRLLLGFLLMMDVVHRGAAWSDMYSTEGVLPTHVNLFRPQAWGAFSIFNAFSTPWELRVLWALMFATFFCLFIGYKTKIMQVLSVIFVTGMNGRILLIENGGYVVNNLLVMWTAFLPLGDRFSVDAMLASMKRRREAGADELNDRADLMAPDKLSVHVSLLGLVLCFQIGAIYFFNVVHKTGPAWKNGTAVHYVLYVDRMATPLIALVRDHVPNFAVIFMTKSALAFEAALAPAVFAPLGRVWARRATIFMMNTLHIAFGTTFVLGPFAWSACVLSTLLFGTEDWDLAYRTMRRAHRARTVVFDPRSPGALLACRILARLDNFELLTFEESSKVPMGLAVKDPARPGSLHTRAAALADIVDALPLGPLASWVFRAPILGGLAEAICARVEQRDASGWLGLRRLPGHPALPGPSPLRRGVGYGVVTLREIFIFLMFAGAVAQASTELWCINRRVQTSRFEVVRFLTQNFSHKMRFLQGWFMFSPNPVMDDGNLVVDAITRDGRHVDPFTGKPPDFDLLNAKSLRLTQIWCDYYNRMHLPANTYYRDAMKDYMYRLPKRTGNPDDAIVSGTVYWIKDWNPKWNETASYGFEKEKLFEFENPAELARAAAAKRAAEPPVQ